jgi:hypothetical protein
MDHRMDERASFAAIQQALGHFLRWQEQQKRRAVEDMASQVGSNSDWDAQSNVSVAETDGDVLGDMKLSKDGGLRRVRNSRDPRTDQNKYRLQCREQM